MADPQVPPEIAAALEKGNLIEAIRLLRQQKNIGLAEAKGMIEALQRQAQAKAGGNVRMNVRTTVRTVRKPAALAGIERHAGLSPGEQPRGGFPAAAGVILLVVVGLALAVYLFAGR